MHTHRNADDATSRSPHPEGDVARLRALFAWSCDVRKDEPNDEPSGAAGSTRHPAATQPGTLQSAHEFAALEALAARGEFLLARDRVIALESASMAADGALFARRLRRHAFAYDAAIGEIVHDPAVPTSEMSRCIDHALREVSSELAATTRRSPRTVAAFLERAHRFVSRFAATVDALEQGTIQRAHAEAILRAGDRIEPAASRAAYEAAVVAGADERTPAQLATFASRIAERLMPEPLESRHERAARERDVWIEDRDDGMAFLGAYGPAIETYAVFARTTADANALRLAERLDEAAAADGALESEERPAGASGGSHLSPRSTRELRWDALAARVLTSDLDGVDARDGTLAAVPANVDVLVDGAALLTSPFVGAPHADTGAGATADAAPAPQEIALLAGRIPVPVSAARELLEHATSFHRVLTDPIDELPVRVDRRFATRAMRELLRVRDAHCRFPGCTRPANRCELDHTVAVQDGGPTALTNLGHLCLGHHILKHRSRWRVRQRERGVFEWVSPTGRTVVTRPEPLRLHAPAPPGRGPTFEPTGTHDEPAPF